MFGWPSVGDILNTIINAVAKMIWGFADSILKDAFQIIDAHSHPSLVYSRSGPLGAVYPITLWVGLIVAFGLALAMAGRVAFNGGEGIGAAVKGLGLYALVTAAGLSLINILSGAADALATGIIKAAFNVDNFSGLAGNSTFMAGAVKGLTGWALGCMSLILVIPFALGLIVEVLIRQGALLVLAATYPIIVAGLVHERFARWYWTGLRWILALVMMTPLIAIGLAIGHSIAQSVGTGHGGSALDAIGQALVSGVICLLSLTAPLVLFKLFAFIDPNSPSGQTARGWFGGGAATAAAGAGAGAAGAAGGEAGAAEAAGGSAPTGTTGDGSGVGSFGDDPAPVASGTGGAAGGSSAGGMPSMGQVMAALGGGLGRTSSTAGAAANGAAAHATDSLDAVGAGHRGGPTDPGDSSDSGDSQQSNGGGDGGWDDPQPNGGGDGEWDDPTGGGGPGVDPSTGQIDAGGGISATPPKPNTELDPNDPPMHPGQVSGPGGTGVGGGAGGAGGAGAGGAGASGAEGAAAVAAV